jgi:PmbA protein
VTQSFVDLAKWQHIVEDVLQMAKREGATSAEVSASVSDGFSVHVRLGEIETIEYHRDKDVELTVYFGQRKGSTGTTEINQTSLEEAVKKACHIAQATQADPCHGLADPVLLAKEYPDLDLYHPWEIDVNHGIEIAKQCEEVGRNYNKQITNSEGASLSTLQGFYIYANSNKFCGHYQSTRHSYHCVLLAEANDGKERDYEFTVARDSNDLLAPDIVGKKAAEKTLARLHAHKLSTRQTPVIFAAHIASGLLGHFVSAISGGNLYRKSSFLLDHLGKKVFPDFVRISEQPHLIKALGSAPFDGEGVATKSRAIVKNGILQGYVLSSYTARKLGLQSTGNAGGVHNLLLHPSAGDLKSLIKKMDTGLLVTEVMGQGVNIVTGDYSRGAAGFWVEKGEIQYPVHEITIAGNLRDMFKNIVATGNDIDHRGGIHTGSILLQGLTIAGE